MHGNGTGTDVNQLRPSDGNPFHKGILRMAIPMERVENRIMMILGHRVMVDTDLIGFERLNFSIPAEEQLAVDALAV